MANDDAAAKAAADRRQAERDQRMKTGKAVPLASQHVARLLKKNADKN